VKKVLILGGGFAGLSALKLLARHPKDCAVTLIDKKSAFDFLPLLPDAISGRLESRYLTNAYHDLQHHYPFEFVQAEVTRVELEQNLVYAGSRAFTYHYLIIASGSVTNFYSNQEIQAKAFKIDDLPDTLKIAQILKEGPAYTWLVVGGGYTGVEMATQIRRSGQKQHRNFTICIVQLDSVIIPALADWERKYVERNLARLEIMIITGASIKQLHEHTVLLTNGRTFTNAAVLWAAGVKAPDFIRTINADKSHKGQLKVDQFLKVKDNCYAVGDTADFIYKGQSLPMLSSYAQQQGRHAARNIIRELKGKKLKSFRPLELGYVIPMANGKACGNLLGINVKGWPALLIHYLSSIYRSYSLTNQLGLLKDLFILPP
jgi:NADH dehydrogenase